MTSESTKENYIFSLILLQTSSSPFRGKLTSRFLCPFLFCLNPFCFSNSSSEVSHRGSCLDYILMTCGAQEVGVRRLAGLAPASLHDKSVGCGPFPSHEPQLKLFCPPIPTYFPELKA